MLSKNFLRLSGSLLSKQIKNELKKKVRFEVEENLSKPPGLGIILVGNKADSKIYVNMKKRACKFVGIQNFDVHMSADVTEEEVLTQVDAFNENQDVHGILIQLPLPSHLNEQRILNRVRLDKDVDGFHLENVGKLAVNSKEGGVLVPCTPAGIMELLARNGIEVSGKNVVVIGRSKIVGIPISLLMLHANATVTVCHSRTRDYREYTRNADIVVVAVGRANMIKADDLKEGAVVVDVGINRVDADNEKGYVIVGDVDFEDVKDKVSAITPVPGGVGPMTIAMLLKHCVDAWNPSK